MRVEDPATKTAGVIARHCALQITCNPDMVKSEKRWGEKWTKLDLNQFRKFPKEFYLPNALVIRVA